MNHRRTPFRGAIEQLTQGLVDAVLEAIRGTLLPELVAALPQEPRSPRAVSPKGSTAKKRPPAAAAEPRKKREEPAWARHAPVDEPEWAGEGTTVITDPMALLKGAVREAAHVAPPPSERAVAHAAPAAPAAQAAPGEPAEPPPPPPPPPSRRIDAVPTVRHGEDILRTGTGVVVLRRGRRRAGNHPN